MNTIVIAYDQRDVRGPIRTRLKALWLFIVGMFMAVLTLPLLVLGRGVLVGLLPARLAATPPRCWSTRSTGRSCSSGWSWP